jgi:hypothetical protein
MVQLSEFAAAVMPSILEIKIPSRSTPRVVDSVPHSIGAEELRVNTKFLFVDVVLFVPRTMLTWEPSTAKLAELPIEPGAPGAERVRVAGFPTPSTIAPLFSSRELAAAKSKSALRSSASTVYSNTSEREPDPET